MFPVRKFFVDNQRPKICASITEEDKLSVTAAADIMVQKKVDIVEWRIDFFKKLEDFSEVEETLKRVHESLGKIPLLVTYRTENEGGNGKLSGEEYRELILNLSKNCFVDLVDVEVFNGRVMEDDVKAFCGDEGLTVPEILEFIQTVRENAAVIGSYHNFKSTPDKETIKAALEIIDSVGCDILKIALMPEKNGDVLRLMTSVNELKEEGTSKPIIAMSMGKIGSVSRVIGESFGSCLTFASVGQESAPGQIEVSKLTNLLDTMHSLR
ncbi:MAG: type I 3-dehydroquinate dehydratase [Lachnospiraceae bacterium]|nr:type I 3-dehydroquinate dehydratase [Lachnospiraceae bacterium]